MTKCKLCGNESHCDRPLKEEQCYGEQMELICAKCRCDICERDYKRWCHTHDECNMYTDERIV